jgi:biotin carboxyl carrier protein
MPSPGSRTVSIGEIAAEYGFTIWHGGGYAMLGQMKMETRLHAGFGGIVLLVVLLGLSPSAS